MAFNLVFFFFYVVSLIFVAATLSGELKCVTSIKCVTSLQPLRYKNVLVSSFLTLKPTDLFKL